MLHWPKWDGMSDLVFPMLQKRNAILRFGIQIQLVTSVFAACSVVSGWFGEFRVKTDALGGHSF